MRGGLNVSNYNAGAGRGCWIQAGETQVPWAGSISGPGGGNLRRRGPAGGTFELTVETCAAAVSGSAIGDRDGRQTRPPLAADTHSECLISVGSDRAMANLLPRRVSGSGHAAPAECRRSAENIAESSGALMSLGLRSE
jgi:hypothetical protein